MGLSRSRTITLVIAIATLTSNTLSSLLFSQIPDDPFHLASYFGWYLHFANLLSVFGFIGAIRQHAPSIAIFANYLIVDTLLCSIPRFLLLTLLNSFSSTLCSTPSSTQIQTQTQDSQWTPDLSFDSCIHLIQLSQLTFLAGLIAATVLQFVGALCVREYAKALWVREWSDDSNLNVKLGRGMGKGGLGGELQVEEVLERGLMNEVRMRWLEEERRRSERCVEEWEFPGLEAIVEGEEEERGWDEKM